MIFSSPVKAPPHTNRILVVSTCRNSCCGCLRPPCGGTDAMVPSMILSKACCTPSPDTPRVIEGLDGMNAQLVLDRVSAGVVATTEGAVGIDQELRHQEKRKPFRSRRRLWEASQH